MTTYLDNILEILEKFIKSFVKKKNQKRLLYLLSKPKRKEDLLWELLHDSRYFDDSCLKDLSQLNYNEIIEQIKSKVKNQKLHVYCTLMFHDKNYKLYIDEAFDKRKDFSEDLIFITEDCRLAYFENHEGEQYLLMK